MSVAAMAPTYRPLGVRPGARARTRDQGPPRLRRPLATNVPATRSAGRGLVPVGDGLERGARGDLGRLLGRDLLGLTGARVATGPGCALGLLDREEAGQRELVRATGDDLLGDLFERLQHPFDVGLGHLGAFRDARDQFTFVHWIYSSS